MRMERRCPRANPYWANDLVGASPACVTHRAYEDIDLTKISEKFLPRTPYRPGDAFGGRVAFDSAIPVWPPETLVTSHYRYVHRGMLSKGAERSLDSAIISQDVAHINGVFSLSLIHI